MPYMIKKPKKGATGKAAKYCVYKEGQDGQPMGDSYGCHDTEKDAQDQMAALYAAEKRMKRPTLREFFSRLGTLAGEFVNGLPDEDLESPESPRNLERAIVDAEWDGAASNYKDTDAYCAACLIDINTGDNKTQDLCKLPIKNASGDTVKKAVHAAAAALAGARGGLKKPDGVSADTWASAVKAAANKLLSIYDKMNEAPPDSLYKAAGKEPPKKNTAERALPIGSIYQQAAYAAYEKYSDAYMVDLYVEDDGKMFIVLASEGKLYRSEIIQAGSEVTISDWIPVAVTYTAAPAAEGRAARSRTTIFRQADGRVRWFSQSCTAVLNRVGEIDGTELFDSFVAHAEATGEYPIRQFYHAGGGFKTGQADWLARDGYTLLTSGLFDDSDIARAEISAREREPEYWGESIGYDALEEPLMLDVGDGIKLPMYRKGIIREISTLPEEHAAALFTHTIQEVMRMALTDRQFQELVRLFGDETKARKWLAENPDATNRAIADGGLVARATADAAAATGTTTAAQTATADAVTTAVVDPTEPPDDNGDDDGDDTAAGDVILDDAAIEQIAGAVIGSEAFQTLSAQVSEMAETVGNMSRTTSEVNIRMQNSLTTLAERLEALEQDENTRQEEWVADLPRAKPARARLTYRPSQNAQADTAGAVRPELSQMAEQTLSDFPE